jgi:hypothetical protein
MLERCLEQLTVDHAVKIIVGQHCWLRLRALLNSVERSTLARNVNNGLVLRD